MLLDLIDLKQIELVIFDNITSLLRGRDENRSDQYASCVDWILGLKAYEITLLILGHMGKDSDRGWRGFSGIEDNIDCTLKLTTPKNWKPADRCDLIVENLKNPRITSPDDYLLPWRFTLMDKEDGSLGYKTDFNNVQAFTPYSKEDSDKIIDSLLLGSAFQNKEIAKLVSVSESTITKHKNKLRDKNFIDKNDKTTAAGREFIKDFPFDLYLLSDGETQ
jgi:hypothetical protein